MSREDLETKIAGRTVRVHQFGVWRALPLWLRVGNAAAPLLRALQSMERDDLARLQAMTEKLDDGVDLAAMMNALPAFADFFEQVSVSTIMEIAAALLVGTTVILPDGVKIALGGEQAKIEAAFGTDLVALLRAIVFAAKANFESSFRQSGFSEATGGA